MMPEADHPEAPSAAYLALQADWQLIRDIRAGARVVREKGDVYLPKFTGEPDPVYEKRRAKAPWSPVYEDSTRTLAAKPFSKEVNLAGDVPDQIREWAENIDYAGNNLHNFAKMVFEESLHMGICFILVDYTATGNATSLGAERAQGARAYWRLIAVDDMFGLVLGLRNGRTYFRQARFRDDTIRLDGFETVVVERVRVLDDIDGVLTSTLWTKADDGGWSAEPATLITGAAITELPIVPVIFGLPMLSAFSVKPPMLDLAHKQIEHYRHSGRLDNLFDLSNFPMLQLKGGKAAVRIEKDDNDNAIEIILDVPTGPQTVLYAPPENPGDRPEWAFIEPAGHALDASMKHQKKLEDEMKELGLQPTMPQVGAQNMAATTSAINAARTHSLIQAWSFITKDALEMALVYMAKWVGLPETAEADVKTDFSADILNDADETLLMSLQVAGIISWDTLIDELLRRDLLGPSFDKEEERKRIDAYVNMKMAEDREDDPADPALRGTGTAAEA